MPILSLIDPNFCVAGGAPRNWYMGVPCNDIDVYLRPGRTFSVNADTQISTPISRILGVETEVIIEQHREDSTLFRVKFSYSGLKFDLNFLDSSVKDPSRAVSDFDFDVCKIEFDTDTMMPVPTRGFFRAMQSKEIQYSPKFKKDCRQHKTFKKLFPKFAHTFLKEADIKEAVLGPKVDPKDWKFTIDEDIIVEFGQ